MKKVLIDLTNQRFGKLTVISRCGNAKTGHATWLCVCDCGSESKVSSNSLRRGNSKSCGCEKRNALARSAKTHGHTVNRSPSRTYRIWQAMITRCENKNTIAYKWYGERGISVCNRWRSSFENFLSDMGEAVGKLQIDRIDNNGNYEPGNCQWATSKENNNNKRSRWRNRSKD